MMKYNHTVDYCVTLKKGSSYALLYKKSSRYISVQLIKINGKKKDTSVPEKSKVQENEYTVLHFV